MGVEHGGHGGDMGGEGGRGVEVETSTHTTHSYPKAPQNLGYWTLAAPKTLQLHYLENFKATFLLVQFVALSLIKWENI